MDNDFEKFPKYKESVYFLLANTADLDVNDDDINKLVRCLINSETVVSGKDYNIPDEFNFVLGKTVESKIKEIEEYIQAIPDTIDEILLYIFVESIAERIKIEKAIKGLSKRITVKIICLQQKKIDNCFISIDSRLNSMIFKRNSDNDVYPEGQLFIAKLNDLVELYNEMGDTLFEKNVRYSISNDKNNVDAAIQDTLEKEPNNFWFYNNGITILADKIECYDTKTIQIYSSPENNFSVINGAQTITACAKYIFNPEVDEQKIIEAKNAYVLLRVITVKRTSKGTLEEKRKIESKISVSLNRQKPIDYEDLAFNSNLVLSINSMPKDRVVDFTICRKGDQEKDEINNTYLLSEVARYVLASKLQSPGLAKNMYKGSILKMEGDSFKKKQILPEIEGEDPDYSFVNQYGLVNLSDKLFHYFGRSKEIADDLKEDQKKQYGQLLENGHYYFISLVIRVLFIDSCGKAKDKINIERIDLVNKKLNQEALDEIARMYKKLVIAAVKEDVDYSQIKKDVLFKDIIRTPYYKIFKSNVIKTVFSPEDMMYINAQNI